MEQIRHYVAAIGSYLPDILKLFGVPLTAFLLLSLLGRLIFGKRSVLGGAVSSAIGILFIFVIVAALHLYGVAPQLPRVMLPFCELSEGRVVLFSFPDAAYTDICTQLAGMLILAFLVSLMDSLLPKGKNLLVWLLFRILTIILSFALHLLVSWVFHRFVPEGIALYAPVILLGVLILLLLTGALKFLVGAVLTTVNPLIAGLYTFFFANIVGKQITKAVLATALLAGLVILLQYLGYGIIMLLSSMLAVYILFILILLLLWYLVSYVL